MKGYTRYYKMCLVDSCMVCALRQEVAPNIYTFRHIGNMYSYAATLHIE